MSRTQPARTSRRRIGCQWPLAGMVVGVVAALTIAGVGGALLRPSLAPAAVPPIIVRLPAPTPSATLAPTLTPETTATASPAPREGPFLVGDLIEVFGTSGDGVRLRSAPSLDGTINGLGQDGEVYQVLEGPAESADYVWWRIVKLDDPTKQGWAVGTFLRLLQ